ncbi:hypothetical protein [Nonomuraea cavernae]|uniref:Uncharacterized protein n=1 Tax=Nonomuraea cavernae TaxID=2045107 RepID=A0A917YZD2_9ACTN|nr:hypothetical protein [Nonomuraea cavernae]MCA2187741.1 hypothetical protein [Nonomuraea cavernae]GGO70633.1 hypothetical protein GCM10012289_34490 [Nonomuraea cavernae]
MELVIVGVTLLVLYVLWDRQRHPRKFCRKCKGSGRQTSRISGRAYGSCQRCGGKGNLRR